VPARFLRLPAIPALKLSNLKPICPTSGPPAGSVTSQYARYSARPANPGRWQAVRLNWASYPWS